MEFLVIENSPKKAKIYDQIGIERIFIDLEIIGKIDRQGHLNTVISKSHSIADVALVKKVLVNSKLLVRCNPVHNNLKNEIEGIIAGGADIIMLPYFKTVTEVEKFISYVNKRVKVCLLLETPEALVRINDILEVEGIDEIHIGLNDLHLGLKLQFMFELVSSGLVDYLVHKIKKKNIRFGIGGIASLQGGMISGRDVLVEHVRLGSSMVILSRTFTQQFEDDQLALKHEIDLIRAEEEKCKQLTQSKLNKLHLQFKAKVNVIVKKLIDPLG